MPRRAPLILLCIAALPGACAPAPDCPTPTTAAYAVPATPEMVPEPPALAVPETAPRYPAAAHGATGSVVVDCIIATSGLVYDCHVVESDGGPLLAQAVLDWLNGPPVQRMPPVMRDGVAVEQLHRWAIYFQPPA